MGYCSNDHRNTYRNKREWIKIYLVLVLFSYSDIGITHYHSDRRCCGACVYFLRGRFVFDVLRGYNAICGAVIGEMMIYSTKGEKGVKSGVKSFARVVLRCCSGRVLLMYVSVYFHSMAR